MWWNRITSVSYKHEIQKFWSTPFFANWHFVPDWLFISPFFKDTLLLAGTSLVKNKANYAELCSLIVKDKDIVFFTLDKKPPRYFMILILLLTNEYLFFLITWVFVFKIEKIKNKFPASFYLSIPVHVLLTSFKHLERKA